MDHDALASLERAEYLAHHVSVVMEAVATLMEGPDPRVLDLRRVPEMFAGCAHCTIEALLYVTTLTFESAKWDGARVRRQIPTVTAQVLTAEVG